VPEGKGDKVKKKIAVLVVLLYIVGTVSGQEFSFRGLPWGSTVEDIIAKEGQPDYPNFLDDFLNRKIFSIRYYNISIAGFQTILNYSISKEEGLYSTSYLIEERYVDKNNISEIFNELEGFLIQLYGTPIRKIETRETTTTQNSTWNKNGTMIRLTSLIQGGSVFVAIHYYAPFSPLNEFYGL